MRTIQLIDGKPVAMDTPEPEAVPDVVPESASEVVEADEPEAEPLKAKRAPKKK